MADYVNFNANSSVRVRLTEHGRAIVFRQAKEKLKSLPKSIKLENLLPVENVDGWSEWPLWELMNELGEHCYNGCDPPFEMTIQFPK